VGEIPQNIHRNKMGVVYFILHALTLSKVGAYERYKNSTEMMGPLNKLLWAF
jgi:hypothetical protein